MGCRWKVIGQHTNAAPNWHIVLRRSVLRLRTCIEKKNKAIELNKNLGVLWCIFSKAQIVNIKIVKTQHTIFCVEQ